ncbi:hypothetical protein [Ilumatobacter sp.]|uniref:hypothetical protein n=1 Tax=Ilumatobacter sp. TaxID=1967498 RepID=UPI003750F509
MAYCTATEVIERMGEATVGAALLGRVTDSIEAATVAIDNDTGRTFSPVTATKIFGAGGYSLEVPDLISVTTLKVDDDDDGTFETTITASEYELDAYHQIADGWPYDTLRLLDREFPHGGRRRRRIEIVGSWGFAAVPSPINQACSLLAAQLAQRATSALFGVQSFGDLGAQGIRTTDPQYMKLIGTYSKPGFA